MSWGSQERVLIRIKNLSEYEAFHFSVNTESSDRGFFY